MLAVPVRTKRVEVKQLLLRSSACQWGYAVKFVLDRAMDNQNKKYVCACDRCMHTKNIAKVDQMSIVLTCVLQNKLSERRKEQDHEITWRQAVRDSRSENDRLLSLLELVIVPRAPRKHSGSIICFRPNS